jgi:preprotein translocase SecE subunit
MDALTTYVRESLAELHQVRWPTRHQAVRLSIIVIVFVLINSIAFGLVDFGLGRLVNFLLSFL